MYLTYGNFTHPAHEVVPVLFRKQKRYGRRGYKRSTLITLVCEGELQYDTQAEFKTAMEALEAAYLFDGYDVVFRNDDGTPTTHAIYSDQTVNGVEVKFIEYPHNKPEEFATKRRFRLTFTAERDDAESQIDFFQERVRFIGNCGPRWKSVEWAYGAATGQTLSTNTVQRIIQYGYAVGVSSYVEEWVPDPLWDVSYEHQQLREREYIGPELRYRNKSENFGVRWRYVFSSNYPLLGLPTVV